MNKLTIFGYGSLLKKTSLKKTVPSAMNIRLGILENYKRTFNLKALRRICPINNTPIAVLNILKSKEHYLNGILFDMDESEFNTLKDREILYDFIEVEIKELKTNKFIRALTPIVHKHKSHEFLFESKEQEDYMYLAVNGAKELGNEFYNIFKETTYIKDKKIKEIKIN